ncbi:DUF6993 domain-containing protein [Agrococcus casei]|uniref:DUF6993 domain-containing protein n=1 Tax=Agrococcus casei TaxID=343512 RepID=UPI003F8F737A
MKNRRAQRLMTAAIAGLSMLVLAGCSHTQLQPVVTPSETPEPTASVDPNSAAGRIGEFDSTLRETWDAGAGVDRDLYIEALVEAGFGTDSMEATDSIDSLGAPVTYIEIAVRIGDTCIIGQAGEAGTSSMLAAPLQTEKCLVGATPPVD